MRDVEVSVRPVVFHARRVVPLPEVVRHVPDHAELVKGLDPLLRQVAGLEVVLPVGPQVGKPAAQLYARGADVVRLDVEIAVLFPVCRQGGKASLPRGVPHAVPDHADLFQFLDPRLAEVPVLQSRVDFPLGEDPVPEAAAVGGFVPPWDFKVAVFFRVLRRFPVHEFP